MVECLTYLVKLFVLLSVLINLFFLRKALLSKLSDLYLIVAGVEKLSLILLYFHPKHLDLLR